MLQSDFIRLGAKSRMASPAELVRTMSAATGVPLPTIVDIDRRLVKGKLRTKVEVKRKAAGVVNAWPLETRAAAGVSLQLLYRVFA